MSLPSLVAQLVKNCLQCRRPQFDSWVVKITWRRDRLPVQFLGGEDPLEKWIGYPLQYPWTSLVAQLVKNLPAMRKTWVWSLGWEDPLEKGTATHSSIPAWRIPWTVQSMGSQRVGNNWATFTFKYFWQRLLRCRTFLIASHQEACQAVPWGKKTWSG